MDQNKLAWPLCLLCTLQILFSCTNWSAKQPGTELLLIASLLHWFSMLNHTDKCALTRTSQRQQCGPENYGRQSAIETQQQSGGSGWPAVSLECQGPEIQQSGQQSITSSTEILFQDPFFKRRASSLRSIRQVHTLVFASCGSPLERRDMWVLYRNPVPSKSQSANLTDTLSVKHDLRHSPMKAEGSL